MPQHEPGATEPEPSVWAGWCRADAEAWAQALLAFPRSFPETTVSPLLRLVLWHDWTVRGALPELECWSRLAADFERAGVTADAFSRFHETAGVRRWSPADDEPAERSTHRSADAAALVAARASDADVVDAPRSA